MTTVQIKQNDNTQGQLKTLPKTEPRKPPENPRK